MRQPTGSSLVQAPSHGPFTRYVKLLVAHAPGMPGTFSLTTISKATASLRARHASRHVRSARAVMHVGIANLWRRGKRSRHSRRMRNPQFYVSGKRPITWTNADLLSTGLLGKKSMKFESEYYNFHPRKCIWKCRLPKWRPFVQGRLAYCTFLQPESTVLVCCIWILQPTMLLQ